MSEPNSLRGPSSAGLVKMIRSGGGAFISFDRALSGLTGGQAHLVPEGSPHSIAGQLAHIHFWQEWVLGTIRGESPPLAEHAAIGWPSVPTDGWPELLSAFRAGIEQCAALTDDERALAEPFYWGQEAMTVGYALLDVAAHNGYHVGQIVLLRQLIHAWPPEGGAYTW